MTETRQCGFLRFIFAGLAVMVMAGCEAELPVTSDEMVTPEEFAESLGFDPSWSNRHFPVNAYRRYYGDVGRIHITDATQAFAGFTHRKITHHDIPGADTYTNWYLFYPVKPEGIILVITFNEDGSVRVLRKAMEGKRFPDEPAWEYVDAPRSLPVATPVPTETASSPVDN